MLRFGAGLTVGRLGSALGLGFGSDESPHEFIAMYTPTKERHLFKQIVFTMHIMPMLYHKCYIPVCSLSY